MKKFMALFLAAAMVLALPGCGGKGDSGQGADGGESRYAQALDVLTAVFGAYAEGDLFAVYGGDQENAVMDAPGKFDVSKTEELDITLGLPQDLAGSVDDAASMVHMMNANTFTGAAYRLKDGTDKDAFAEKVKSGILSRQWICGQPDTLVIIDVDGTYLITAFGVGEIVEVFKNNALSALEGAKVMVETPIA